MAEEKIRITFCQEILAVSREGKNRALGSPGSHRCRFTEPEHQIQSLTQPLKPKF